MSLFSVNDWKALDSLARANSADLEAVCATIARIVGVDPDGVGLLKVRGLTLEFVYPIELKSAGRIPLSSSAVAASTATTKKSALFNDFTRVTHNSIFELVPLGGSANGVADPRRIQKLMSAPVVDNSGKALGVVQISRKGPTRDEAGPDFTEADLQNLNKVTQHLAMYFTSL